MILNWLKKKKTEKELSLEEIEELCLLQEEDKKALYLAISEKKESLIPWARKIQKSFSIVLEDKESYIADTSALPYPESWIRLAFKVQALRCVLADQEAFFNEIEKALKHLAAFQNINPRDFEKLVLIEKYREEILKKKFSPQSEDKEFLSDGSSLKEVLRAYTRALPCFNSYNDRIKAKEADYIKDFKDFIHSVKNT